MRRPKSRETTEVTQSGLGLRTKTSTNCLTSAIQEQFPTGFCRDAFRRDGLSAELRGKALRGSRESEAIRGVIVEVTVSDAHEVLLLRYRFMTMNFHASQKREVRLRLLRNLPFVTEGGEVLNAGVPASNARRIDGDEPFAFPDDREVNLPIADLVKTLQTRVQGDVAGILRDLLCHCGDSKAE